LEDTPKRVERIARPLAGRSGLRQRVPDSRVHEPKSLRVRGPNWRPRPPDREHGVYWRQLGVRSGMLIVRVRVSTAVEPALEVS